MGYSIRIKDKSSGETAVIPESVRELDYPRCVIPEHGIDTVLRIGPELSVGITYNYSRFFYRETMFGENGIRSLYGIPMPEAKCRVMNCICTLNWADPTSEEWKCDDLPAKGETPYEIGWDYFCCCIYNVRNTLLLLNDMIQMCMAIDPDGWQERFVFEGD